MELVPKVDEKIHENRLFTIMELLFMYMLGRLHPSDESLKTKFCVNEGLQFRREPAIYFQIKS